jgi:hypothetical protein
MEQTRLAALTDHVEEVLQAAAPEQSFRRERLRSAIDACGVLDRSVLSLGFILGAAASLEEEQVRSFLSRLPTVLNDRVLRALDRVSETLLMITDRDLEVSGTVVASLLVQRSLPRDFIGRDRVLRPLLQMIETEYQERARRHREIFAPLRRLEETGTLAALPPLLMQTSEALEDMACEKSVFLNDPIDLVAKERDTPDESAEEAFRAARVDSSADTPMLGDETEQVEALAELVGWSRNRGFQLATQLYQHKVMDSRTKVGLSVRALVQVIGDVNAALDLKTESIELDTENAGRSPHPYSFNLDTNCFVLHLGRRGITSRSLKADQEVALQNLKDEKEYRESSALERTIKHYDEVRAAMGRKAVAAEVETPEVDALTTVLGRSAIETYALVTKLHETLNFAFVAPGERGVSLKGVRELIEGLFEPGDVSSIVLDPTGDPLVPIDYDSERKTFKLHTAFEGLTDESLRRTLDERLLKPRELIEPDVEVKLDYQDPDQGGSLGRPHNMNRFIEEFKLPEEHAEPSFEVLLEGCSGFSQLVSVQCLRVLLTNFNRELPEGHTIDLVTGWSRQLPGGSKPDSTAIGWLSTHTEDDLTFRMMTFNFHYGEGKSALPPFSDKLLLEWARYYRVPEDLAGVVAEDVAEDVVERAPADL